MRDIIVAAPTPNRISERNQNQSDVAKQYLPSYRLMSVFTFMWKWKKMLSNNLSRVYYKTNS